MTSNSSNCNYEGYSGALHTQMLGCFNPILGQIWTNPAVGLNLLIAFLNPTFGFVHILPKIRVKTTQHFLECTLLQYNHYANTHNKSYITH